ncbi:MAG: leucine-rich repeat protein [Lachnospiraceae bacterium]|nr:leucine-rich repeat protein [Lachnospiraceae bacterium]
MSDAQESIGSKNISSSSRNASVTNASSKGSSSSSGGGSDSTSANIKTAGKGAAKAYYIKTGKGTVRYDTPDLDTKAVAIVVPSKVKIGKKEYKVTAISAKAFDGYDKLRSVTIGKNVKKIGKSAFAGCRKLKTITIQSKKLTKKNIKYSLKDSYIKTVRVPSGMAEKYKKIFKKKNVGSKYKITIKEK